MSINSNAAPHTLAEPFATALFGSDVPEPIDFVMLLTEVSQLTPSEYASMWSDMVTIARGAPVTARERAEYALSAPSRVVEAARLAAMMGEVSDSVQTLVVRTLRLSLQRQVKPRQRREPVLATA